MNRDKVRQVGTARVAQREKGIAQAINDLSNPLGLTLNQRAVGSTPTRPTTNQPLTYLVSSDPYLCIHSVGSRTEKIFFLAPLDQPALPPERMELRPEGSPVPLPGLLIPHQLPFTSYTIKHLQQQRTQQLF